MPERFPIRRPKLLIVDDEKDVADFIAEVAQGLGYETVVINDGRHFLNSLSEHKPMAIVLDLGLPGYDGVELLRFLAEQHSTACVFIASGADPRTIAAAKTLGNQYKLNICGTFSKPIKIEELEHLLLPTLANSRKATPNGILAALGAGEIVPLFQPKVNLNSAFNKIVGVEALARWVKPSGQHILPDEFLPAVANFKLMPELTTVIVEKSFKALKVWLDEGLDIVLSINIDGSMLTDLKLPDKLDQQAREFNIPPERITFEITETAVMEDTATTMDVATRLRLKGFNLAIDDFGTGYSSLVQLYNLPFNELKIDKSFVLDIETNTEARVIVDILTMLGRKLGLKVCAEGIETEAALSFIRASGCDTGQGFLFSEAVNPETILKFALSDTFEK
ncbi:EAL domain-containing response regulator [Kordiimonas pumila]|uniref:EAL domain-containing protein n=1 Tax=Kordiimonas pumila TaxID=2161677 RepID=A0ABV7D485_9PROT|nr:EAL domain-containing response regulator [Kordiimonas pumila]